MHCTGLGKVLLAYKNPPEIKWIIANHGLRKMTTRTITDRVALDRELAKIRKQGYAIDNGEIMDNLRCIAAPIFNSEGKVEFAISVSALACSFRGKRFEKVRDELILTAESISYMMGYRQPHD